jgi:hypothetical protein
LYSIAIFSFVILSLIPDPTPIPIPSPIPIPEPIPIAVIRFAGRPVRFACRQAFVHYLADSFHGTIFMRGTMLLGTIACVAIMVGSACDILGSTDPDVAFSSEFVESDDTTASSASYFPSAGSLLIEGLMTMPNRCYGMRGNAKQDDGTISVTVTAHLATQNCPENEPATYQYTMVINSLRSGNYQVKIVHNFSNSAKPPKTVVDQTVRID